MSERVTRWAPAALILVLALALVPQTDVLELAGTAGNAEALTEVLDELPSAPVVLVGFDADLGTYAEIRPTVRALLADLLERDATLVFVSLTPEGRALAIAERTRLVSDGVDAERLVDEGFVPGAEAGLVALARSVGGDDGALLGLPAEASIALGVIIGGNDLGPRSWVEQVVPRVDGLELIAVAPSVLLPEIGPYLESGQLRAVLATPRDGAAYRASLGPDAGGEGPRPLAVLAGMLVGIGVLGAALVRGIGDALRRSRGREPA